MRNDRVSMHIEMRYEYAHQPKQTRMPLTDSLRTRMHNAVLMRLWHELAAFDAIARPVCSAEIHLFT